jgi:hypothetical protein
MHVASIALKSYPVLCFVSVAKEASQIFMNARPHISENLWTCVRAVASRAQSVQINI